jgi:hypothetical protein
MEGLRAARSAMSRQSIFRTFKLCRRHSDKYYDQPLRRYVSKELVLPQKHAVATVRVPLNPGPWKTLTRVGPANLARQWSRRRFITTEREGFTYDRLTEALGLTPECLKMQAWPLLEREIILPQRITSEAPRSPANDTQRRR